MKIKFWILVVIIYKVPGNVSCKFKSYRGGASLLYEKATTDKKHKILRILCFFVTISCDFVVGQNL